MQEERTGVLLEHVTKVFGTTEALRDLSLTFPAGRVSSVLGPNGAGKTTTIQMIVGLLKPTAGRVRVFGLDPARHGLQIRALTGLVMQQTALDLYLTGWENLELQASLYGLKGVHRKRRVEELLAWSGLEGDADRLTRTYSGGMRRRLDLAISLLHRPRILILDEPTTGLDVQTRHQLWSMIRELREMGTTVILTTHYLEEADQLSDQIAVLRNGGLVAQGTPLELKERLGSDMYRLTVRLRGEAGREILNLKPQQFEGDQAVWHGPSRELYGLLNTVVHRWGADIVEARVSQPSLDEIFLKILNDEKFQKSTAFGGE
ncbi:ABC transporter ATP-binding protein [Limnochorda pilosa]|uniref:Lysozyme n=1 Tax=Limnochorda pilosa TaxID=1555112 RepID=A0A0K2SH43_LIMPI|nr:ABC transporter ATP-binding protein [Limnochorda pilosa]BAS26352.1 lysozyme [Limnochorda pilosa]